MRFPRWSIFALGAAVLSVVAVSVGFFVARKKKEEMFERPRVAYEVPAIKMATLPNGLKVFVLERARSPKVILQIAYGIGSSIEQANEHGLAHLLEHMIFKGTDRFKEGEIDAVAKRYGADLNAFTSKEMTSYFFEVNKNNWKPFMDILADCAMNAKFHEQHLASELKAVIQELRRDEDNYWTWMVNKSFELLFPSTHPYHHPIIGYKQDLLSVSSERLQAFYVKYYKPNNAALFVVGDVDGDEVIRVATSYFKDIPAAKEDVICPMPSSGLEITSRKNTIYKDIKKELLGFYWPIPGLAKESKALTAVVDGVLAGGEGGVLYRRLVDKDKIASDITAMSYRLKDAGVCYIFIEPKDGCAQQCRDAVAEELKLICEKGVRARDVTKVVRLKERAYLQTLESNASFAYQWIESYMTTGDPHHIFNRIQEFYAVTKDRVSDFIKSHLDPFFMNELQVLPIPESKKELWLLNKQKSEAMDRALLQKFQRTLPLNKPIVPDFMPKPEPVSFSFPRPDKTYELENGLKVILHRSGDVPLVKASLKFKDAEFISKAKEGRSASVMMSMLMEGSVGFTKDENVDFFELHGAAYAFGTGGVGLSLFNVGYKPVFARAMHVLTKPAFKRNTLKKVKDLFIDSYQRHKDVPASVAKNTLNTVVYKDHPYGWDFDEAMRVIDDLSLRDMTRLHRTYVQPKNMTLIVVGDFELDAMQDAIKDTFGGWQGDGERLTVQPVQSNGAAPQDVDKKMLRDQVVLLFGRPSGVTVYDEDYHIIKLLNFICFAPGGSILWDLRERTGLFYSAGGGIGNDAGKIHGVDYVWAMVSVDKVATAQEQIRDLLDAIKENGIEERALEDARIWYLKRLIDLTASNGAIASSFGFLDEYGFKEDYFDRMLEGVQRVDLQYMNDLCKKHLGTHGLSRIRVGRVTDS